MSASSVMAIAKIPSRVGGRFNNPPNVNGVRTATLLSRNSGMYLYSGSVMRSLPSSCSIMTPTLTSAVIVT